MDLDTKRIRDFKLQSQNKDNAPPAHGDLPISAKPRELMRELSVLPGHNMLDRILSSQSPQGLTRGLPSEDFFWLVKKIGVEDCLPLLELASEDQWQYLLDLEIWRKDRPDMAAASLWLERLLEADPLRLIRWLINEGQTFAHYHLLKSIEVVITTNTDEIYNLPDGFFSLDGTIYIRVLNPEHRETIEKIIRGIAAEDLNIYQNFLLGLAGLIPAEAEEELYRMKNLRLAEHGFLPREEALSIYSPLDPDALPVTRSMKLSGVQIDADTRTLVPFTPLSHTGTENMLTQVLSGMEDPHLLDRIRLEFAGLCNQIISADGLPEHELDILIGTCRKAARCLNLAIDRLAGRDFSSAEKVLRNHSLVTLFQVGFGLVLKLKWEAERWIKGSWFHGSGLDTGFWGEPWGETLHGLLQKKPRFFIGVEEEDGYKDFEWLSELADCLKVVRRLMVLDSLMDRLAETFPVDEELIHVSGVTFHPFLFNLWSRHLLKLDTSFSGITLDQAKTLFRKLRAGKRVPPYRMAGFKGRFINEFTIYAPGADPEAAGVLLETLGLIWNGFNDEYEWIELKDLDGRFSRCITITPPT